MQHGTEDQCKCPHCKKMNWAVVSRDSVRMGQIVEFEKPCQHCKKPIYFWARWGILVDAEKPDRAR